MTIKTVIVVEDEKDIQEILHYNLSREGFEVLTADDGQSGYALINDKKPDLVLLDLMLPGMDGLEICRLLKSHTETQHVPIIMLTAKSAESDIVLGLGIGADDYVTKPFSIKEVIARVKALLRRVDAQVVVEDVSLLQFSGLTIHPDRYEVKVDEAVVPMTLTEFKLLYQLARKPDRVFTRDQLVEAAVGENTVVIDRNIDVHILSIRKKLGPYRHFIETVRGVGYRFNVEKT